MATQLISDLHLRHKSIHLFDNGVSRPWSKDEYGVGSLERHDEELIKRINSKVAKKDKLFILGDVVFGKGNLEVLNELNGIKHLILGNHDTQYFNYRDYTPYFHKVSSLESYKGFWLSHAPIHPQELRGKGNIHGHVHTNDIMLHRRGRLVGFDDRYINVCAEVYNGYPIPFDDIESGDYWENRCFW